MTNIVKIPFHGEEILTVAVDGKPHIILRPAIERLGLDYRTQQRKLESKSWATVGMVPTVAADGKTRQMVTVDVRTFLMLLATVDEHRVSNEVRPILVAYQAEIADVIEAYWAKGGAINPRATEDQLTAVINRAERQARVLSTLKGIVDPAWLDAKGRHVAAIAMGIEPDIDPASRPLTVGQYLEGRGITGAALRSLSPSFGKHVKALFRQRYGTEPHKVDRFVDGALRPVAAYTEAHRDLFDQAWQALVDVA